MISFLKGLSIFIVISGILGSFGFMVFKAIKSIIEAMALSLVNFPF